MQLSIEIRSAVDDFMKGGLGFLVAGLKSRFSKGATTTVRLPDCIDAVVRTRQSDFSTLRQTLRDKEYAFPEHVIRKISRYQDLLRQNGYEPVIIDAGANIGAASIWFRKQFPEIKIIAIEPDDGNVAILRQNIECLSDTHLMHAALGSTRGNGAVIVADRGWTAMVARGEGGCPIVTIADALATIPAARPLIVKIDIEGFEEDLFARNLGWLDEVGVVIIEPHDWMLPDQATSRNFQRAFGEREFDLFIRGENLIYVRRTESMDGSVDTVRSE
jgi:FkbM family methyltransferase